jgi:hypothetical protein
MQPDADVTAPKQRQRGRPFQKGRSGNPAGRPPGTRNATTVLAEQLLDDEAERLVRVVIDKALAGDLTALRVCLDRIVPPRRDRAVRFNLPKISSAGDVIKAMAAVLAAVARGELAPAEAAELSRLIEGYAKALEASKTERRLQFLEDF